MATYCVRKQSSLSSVTNSRGRRALIATLALEAEGSRLLKTWDRLDSWSLGWSRAGANSGLPDSLRDPAVECWVKAGCYQNDSVLYFCFYLCLMGKCLSNDDGYGDEKEEMLNWRKNIFEILLPSFSRLFYYLVSHC